MSSEYTHVKNVLQSYIIDGGFLQSTEWRNFQELTGRRTFVFKGARGYASIIEHTLPIIGRYWYMPRGPILETNQEASNDVAELITKIIKKAKQERVNFIRFEPANEECLKMWVTHSKPFLTKKLSFTVQPKELLVIDIEASGDALLSRMKSKTRYNIRLAQKKGVVVRTSSRTEDIEAFCDLVEETAKRDGIVSHPRAYYTKMFQSLPQSMIQLYIAEYQGKILAASSIIFFGEYATYLHGASSNYSREVMAPYLLQWQQICDAKKRGCKKYDFGGVNTNNTVVNTWQGITRFKQGFSQGTDTLHSLGAYDTAVSPFWYRCYAFAQLIKKFLRKVKYL